MAYPISALLEGHGDLVSVKKEDSLIEAFNKLKAHDFSQLPVIDEEGKTEGIVTFDSILSSMIFLGMSKIENKTIERAIQKVKTIDIEDNLDEVLDTIRDESVVLVEQNNIVVDIVTSYDVIEFFKKRALDMIYLEEIEEAIKDTIREFFKQNGEINEEELEEAVIKIQTSDSYKYDSYVKGLEEYLRLVDHAETKINWEASASSFTVMYPKRVKKDFSALSLSEYNQMLLHKERWDFTKSIVQLDRDELFNLLDEVRKTRNILAHFRDDITPLQREQLAYCKKLLDKSITDFQEETLGNHSNDNTVAQPELTKVEKEAQATKEEQTVSSLSGDEIIPYEEDDYQNRNKYSPLTEYLSTRPGNMDKIQLSFSEIEQILGAELPPSAYTMRAWWANDSVGHVQSKEWLSAGWRVGYRNMKGHWVTFVRIVEREANYIKYFSPLLSQLQKETQISLKEISPSGANWITVVGLMRNNAQKSIMAIAFSQSNRYRIELYIDAGDQQTNKAIFDDLYAQKEEIESQIGDELTWERMPNKRASRIALYNRGNIDMPDEKLANLRKWTVQRLPVFYDALYEKAMTSISNMIQ